METSIDFPAVMTAAVGPALFRLIWWNHLDSSKRSRFKTDLVQAIVESMIRAGEEAAGLPMIASERFLAANFISSTLSGIFDRIDVPLELTDETFEAGAARLLAARDQSELHRQFAAQFEVFTSRTAQLSDSLVSAVKIINEEFIIWLKSNPNCTERIHSDTLEQLTGEILTSHGFSVQFTGRVKNKSADLFAIGKNEDGVNVKYLVECKRYSSRHKVDLNILNAVIGSSFRAKTDHAMLVTTSSFTRNAIQAHAELEEFRLDLCDGLTLNEWLRDYEFNAMGLWLPKGWEDEWTDADK